MTLPIPLTVRLSNANTDRHVTRDLRELSFRSVVNGGFASAAFSLDRAIHIDSPELAYYTDVEISDTRTGRIAWNGGIEDLDPSVGPDGLVWEVAAIGPSAHAHDRTLPYLAIDNSIDRWDPLILPGVISVHPGGSYSTGSSEDGDTAQMDIRVPEGTTVDASSVDQSFPFRYRGAIDAGVKLARIYVAWDAGFNGSTVWDTDIVTRQGFIGTGTQADTNDITTSGGALGAFAGIEFTNGHNVCEFRLRRASLNSVIADSNVWLWGQPRIWAMRVDKTGTELTGSINYSFTGLSSVQLVEDILGRLLPLYDGANAEIIAPGFLPGFVHFAYPDGVTPAKLFADIAAIQTDVYWAAWEKQANGKYRFRWGDWPTTSRYQASVRDGYTEDRSGADLYNRALVRFTGPASRHGTVRQVERTLTVPELDDQGRIRSLYLDLGDNITSTATAQLAGDNALAAHAATQTRGRLTIARPILDRNTGIMVQPWELRPGELVDIQETGRTHRIIATDYLASSASASLELDSPPFTPANILSRRAVPGRRGTRHALQDLPIFRRR